MQLGLLRIKSGRKQENLHPIPGEFPEGFARLLPFQLTGAQRRAITEALEDMAGDSPMTIAAAVTKLKEEAFRTPYPYCAATGCKKRCASWKTGRRSGYSPFPT